MSGDAQSDLELSEEQLAAVNSDSRALVVVASAGSGKTEVVARRVQRILQGAGADGGRVLAVSYTVKAADELRARLQSRTGALSERVDTETIHGFAHRLIRQHGTKLGLPIEPELLTRDEDRAELLTRWREDQGEPALEDPMALLRQVDLERARLQDSQEVRSWKDALGSIRALDYPALLVGARELMDLRSVRHQLRRLYTDVIVDEAQNLTPAQYELMTALIGEPGLEDTTNAMIVGDDKQSIISFAGADPGLLRQFAQVYSARIITLTINFRSATAITQLADAIAEDLGTKPTQTIGHAASGLIRFQQAPDENAEGELVADWISGLRADGIPDDALAPKEPSTIRDSDIAVLGRSGTALRQVASALEQREIPFSAASGRTEWLDGTHANLALELVAWKSANEHQSVQWQLARLLDVDVEKVAEPALLRASFSESGDPLVRAMTSLLDSPGVGEFIESLRAIEVPRDLDPRALADWSADSEQLNAAWDGFGQATPSASQTWANFGLHCARQQRGDSTYGVQLLTIHKAQGREFRAVALVGLNDGQLPDFRAKSTAELVAELRTFYVAVTRCRRTLLLTRARQRATRYGSRRSDPSPYLKYLATSPIQ